MRVALVIPPLVSRANDVLGSGIYYMPYTMAYLAGRLREAGHEVAVHDMFAAAPHRITHVPPMMNQGIAAEELPGRFSQPPEAVFVFAWGVTSFKVIGQIARALRGRFPELPIVVVENSQAVTGMSLAQVAPSLLAEGVDYLILGECEERAVALLDHIAGKGPMPADGWARMEDGAPRVIPADTIIADLDALPFPAWELFPVKAYWELGYAHGPQEGNYLAILTSRGCPFGCKFCVVPSTNHRRWRARSAQSVYREMCHLHETLGVREFHFEDVNPTTREQRLVELADLIRTNNKPFIWKFASGTKIETISLEGLRSMAAGGCSYVSFSPETGSDRVLKLMGKPFDRAHALEQTKEMAKLGVASQAVFLIGFPGETDEDRVLTEKYMGELIRAGLDEVLILIVSPVPGSAIFDQFSGYGDYSELTFSPTWRKDYAVLEQWQKRLYRRFFLLKAIHQPLKCCGHAINVLRRRFKTKMEMTFWRWAIVKRDMRRAH